jgi:hypothetical protein
VAGRDQSNLQKKLGQCCSRMKSSSESNTFAATFLS